MAGVGELRLQMLSGMAKKQTRITVNGITYETVLSKTFDQNLIMRNSRTNSESERKQFQRQMAWTIVKKSMS